MAYATDRVILFDRNADFACELSPSDVFGRVRVEEINGEHELTLITTRVLTEGTRVLTQDGTGKWREHVIYKPDRAHQKGENAIGTYTCMWSLQYDLMSVYADEHAEPGMGSQCTGMVALQAALDGQTRWSAGLSDVSAVAAGQGCVMIGVSAWERLKLVVQHWHGEVDARIVVDGTSVTARYVDLRAHLGSETATRRFDWGADLKSISRDPDPGPYYCRIIPLGRGQREYAEDDKTEFDWPIDISEETGGVTYIQDDDAAAIFRTKNPDGTYHYPVKVVHYDEDDPELLYNAGLADLHNRTRPKVKYSASVVQFARAGMDVGGVELGDNTQCIDRGFDPDTPLAIEGRILRMVVNELSPKTDTELTIGDLGLSWSRTITDLVGESTRSVTQRVENIERGGTITYFENLVEQLNEAINAMGGWMYSIPGEGIISYDREVADPLVGTEATSVTQIKGGAIRIANSKKPSFAGINDWNWRTLIVSGHIAAELVTAVQITAGFIGNTNGNFFLDLDNNEVSIGNNAQIGGTTVGDLLSDVESAGISGIDYGVSASSATAPTTWSSDAPTDVPKGSWLWVRTTYKDGTSTVSKAYAGEDGTSVSILGSYNTLADLQAAHPTGDVGDGYIVNGDLYVWDGSQWLNVGRIQGPAGQDGTSVTIASREVKYARSSSGTAAPTTGWQDNPPSTSAGQYLWSRTTVNYNDGTNTVTYNVAGHGMDGTSVTITKTEYGTSTSASSQPSSWSTTTPTSIAQGSWLWVRTTYSDGSSATSKSYVGTDGEDGTSVYVKSSTKSGDVTTVVITDGDSDTTLTIRDGDDGTNGINGLNGYVHTAWANSANGTLNFSTTDSAGKLYLGVYTDNVQADSQSPADYSWSLIKGANGAKGDKGDKGDTGDAARAYSIVISPDALRRDGDTITPSEITVSATVAVGTATPTAYMGRYRIEEYDGSTWTTKYTSNANESSKTYQPTSTARMVRCTLFAAGGTTTRLDSQTVPVLSDGADGADGTNGTNGSDAYSVWLTNDSHLFPASGSAALSGNVVTYIKAYKGTSPIRPVTIGTLPTPPTGMTLTKLNNGSSSADAGIRVTVTTSLVTRSGTIDIPVTADGRSFTATFSWALALEGTGVKSVVPQYYLSTSSTTATGGSWSSNPPTWSSGKYIWTRNFITWDSNPVRTSTTDAVYDAALTQANQQAAQARTEAADAAKVATNYLKFTQDTGLDVGYQNTSAKTRVNGSGITIYDGNGNDRLNASTSGVRIGKSNSNRALISDSAFELLDSSGASTFKAESSLVRVGELSNSWHANINSNYFTIVNNKNNEVFYVGDSDSPIVAVGHDPVQMLFGLALQGVGEYQTVLGKYNKRDTNSIYALIIGNGTNASNRSNAFAVGWDGGINTGAYTYFKSTNLDRDGSNPSSLTHGNAQLILRDKDNETIGAIWPLMANDGTTYLRFEARAENTSGTQVANYLDIRVNRSGTQSYAMSNPTAFREAIGMPTTSVSGEATSSKAGFEPRLIGTDIQYAAINVSSFYAHKVNGRMVQFYLSGTLGVSVSANGSTVLGTIPTGYRPIRTVGVDASSVNRRATVNTSGSVTLYTSSAISSGASVTITGVYISSS